MASNAGTHHESAGRHLVHRYVEPSHAGKNPAKSAKAMHTKEPFLGLSTFGPLVRTSFDVPETPLLKLTVA
jgi:hypothetical protein